MGICRNQEGKRNRGPEAYTPLIVSGDESLSRCDGLTIAPPEAPLHGQTAEVGAAIALSHPILR